jgi:hypothetical protein
MKKKILVLALVSLLPACTESRDPGPAAGGVVSDREVLAEAEAAANDVIRNAADCEAVAESFGTVMAKLDEAEGRVQTAVGRTTLGTLRKQVTIIGDACGATR